PDVQRLRNTLRHHAAIAIEDREGEVLALLDDGGIARAQHVERELARDLQRGLIDDFEVDGVQRCVLLRSSCWRKRHPVSTIELLEAVGGRCKTDALAHWRSAN